MNLHPNILNLAGLVDKPRSPKEMAHMVNLIEEESSVLAERAKLEQAAPSRSDSRTTRNHLAGNNGASGRRPVKCRSCGRTGYIRINCPRS